MLLLVVVVRLPSSFSIYIYRTQHRALHFVWGFDCFFYYDYDYDYKKYQNHYYGKLMWLSLRPAGTRRSEGPLVLLVLYSGCLVLMPLVALALNGVGRGMPTPGRMVSTRCGTLLRGTGLVG